MNDLLSYDYQNHDDIYYLKEYDELLKNINQLIIDHLNKIDKDIQIKNIKNHINKIDKDIQIKNIKNQINKILDQIIYHKDLL